MAVTGDEAATISQLKMALLNTFNASPEKRSVKIHGAGGNGTVEYMYDGEAKSEQFSIDILSGNTPTFTCDRLSTFTLTSLGVDVFNLSGAVQVSEDNGTWQFLIVEDTSISLR